MTRDRILEMGLWFATAFALTLLLILTMSGCLFPPGMTDEQLEAVATAAERGAATAAGTAAAGASTGNAVAAGVGTLGAIIASALGYAARRELRRRKEARDADRKAAEHGENPKGKGGGT